MDVKQQEYFVAIVEEGSISKAAKKLYISQPTLSQFLAKLENSLNVRLVTRSNNMISLTEAGRLYYEYAKKMISLRDEFDNRLSDLNESGSTSLVIGNNLEKAMVMLNDIVSELSVKYPKLKVMFQYGNPYQLQEMVVDGTLDMGFSCYNHKNPQLEYMDFPAFEMVIVLPASHPLAHLGSRDLHEGLPHMDLKRFEKEKFILVKEGTVTGDITREYCTRHGVDLDVCIEVYNGSFALASVACGLGVSIFPPETLDNRIEDVRYIGLDPPLYYKRALYYSKNTYQTAAFRDYVKIVRRLVETDSLFRKL